MKEGFVCAYKYFKKIGNAVCLNGLRLPGEMAEWSKAVASKAIVSLNGGTVGSNPTLSTKYKAQSLSMRLVDD